MIWTRLPPQPSRLHRANRLARGVTHLVNGGFPVNAVTHEIATQNVTSRVIHPTPWGDAYRCNGESKGWAFRATAAQINARNPWTIAGLFIADAGTSGIVTNTTGNLGISNTVGSNGGTFDRCLNACAGITAGVLQTEGKLFDGASKEIFSASSTVDVTRPSLYTCVVTAFNGTLYIWTNGVLGGTLAVSNNGHAGYTDPIYFNVASQGNTGVRILVALKTDNAPWGQSEAVDFARNPFNLFAPRPVVVYSIPAAAAGTNALIAVTESTDSAIITVANWRNAQIAASESSDTAALVGIPARVAQISAADTRDAAAVTAANWRTAQIAASDSTDATSVTAANWKTAQIAATDAADNAALTGTPAAIAAIVANDSPDAAAIAAEAATRAAIAANETSDTSSIVATAIRTAQIAATEASDSAAVATIVTSGAAIAATDGADSAALAAVAWRTAQIVATESPDTAQIVAEGIAGTASAAIVASDSADTAALATIVATGAGIVATDGADNAALMVSVPAIAVADTGVRHGPLPPRRHFPQPILVRAHTAQAGQITRARATLSLVVVSARTRQAGQVTEAEMIMAMEGQAMTTQAPSVRAFAWLRMVGSGKSWQAGQGAMVAANAAMQAKVMSGIFPRDPPPTYDGPSFEGLDPRFRNAA